MKLKLMVVLCALVTAYLTGYRVGKNIAFDQNVRGYLKRATTSSTVPLAIENLNIALRFIEKKDMTHGYTSVLWNTPDEDVAFWYRNLKASENELRSLSIESTPLEKSNMLIKLRGTLIDHRQKGDIVIVPAGISIHPYNVFYAWLYIVSVTCTIIACVILLYRDE